MKKGMLLMTLKWTAVLGIGILLVAQVSVGQAKDLKTDNERESYAIGVDLARNLKRQGVEAQADALVKGFRDGFSGAKLLMTEEELRSALTAFQIELKGAD